MIEFQQVSRNYGSKVAVDGLDLQIAPGELYALLGHNGAGKTTTIKLLVGLLQPGAGYVRVGGYDVASHPRESAALIGYVPDEPYLYEKLTGREFLTFVAEMYGLDSPRLTECIEREIERFDLQDFVDDLTESYSHGMKQRTVFASAMLHSPRVLVVDEPLVGLDPHSIRLVKDLLCGEVAQGMCVLMSTHTLSAAEEVSTRLGVMAKGSLLFDGSIDELRQQMCADGKSLESMYLTLVDQSQESTP